MDYRKIIISGSNAELNNITATGIISGNGSGLYNFMPTGSITLNSTNYIPSGSETVNNIYFQKLSSLPFLSYNNIFQSSVPVQTHIARRKVGHWNPSGNNATVPGLYGIPAHTIIGTSTSRAVATTNLLTRSRRLGIVSAATLGSIASIRSPAAQFTSGTGTMGGFLKIIRFGISDDVLVAGARIFVGMRAGTTTPTDVEPSALSNCIGVGSSSTDTNFKLYYGGNSMQPAIDFGSDFPSNTTNTDLYELCLFSPTNENTTIYYEFVRLNTGHAASGKIIGTTTAILPSNNTLIRGTFVYRSNNATAAAVGIDIISDYIETDF